jgi:hypothetical protein
MTIEDPHAPSEAPTPSGVVAQPGTREGDLQALTGDVLPAEAVFRRAEDKPPLYRFFRGGMYVSYMMVVVWFCLSIIVGALLSVWGESGDALRNRQQKAGALQALPTPDQ